jgi:hypothetical protein
VTHRRKSCEGRCELAEGIDPDLPALDTLGFERPGNRDVRVGFFYDYRLNLDKYAAFQQ